MVSSIIIGVAAAFVVVIWISWTHFAGAVWASAPSRTVKRMLDMAKVGKDDVVYDLGSGDGRILRESAKRGATSVGFEIDPLRVMLSRILISLSGQSKLAKTEWKNIFDKNMSFRKASVVTLFLMQETNDKLKDKLIRELPDGARIVSYLWKFKNWKPTSTDNLNKIYVYTVRKN